jgi:hypothetical protein
MWLSQVTAGHVAYKLADDPEDQSWTVVASSRCPGIDHVVHVTDLAPSTSYTYAIVAQIIATGLNVSEVQRPGTVWKVQATLGSGDLLEGMCSCAQSN